MFYHIAQALTPVWPIFNVIHYSSFRVMAALLTTLTCSFLWGDWFIGVARQYFRSKARAMAPQHHQLKDNLPTMGGLFILLLVSINTLLWCNLTDPHVWVMLFGMGSFGAIGAWDDWVKITTRRGISAKAKFILQLVASFLTVVFWVWSTQVSTTITFPFFKNVQPDIGWYFIPWAMLVIIGCSNAVNLTDGLDGLAIGTLMPNLATYAVLCSLAGNMHVAHYLHIPFAGTSEVALVGMILVGASLGFLWYNAYPALIFMGDVGSLALGAGLALLALQAKQELLLIVSGAIFVAETMSVILQVLSYKLRGKRLFKMAPMHHHFELIGWHESKITMRFAIISLMFCLFALISIKVR